MEEGLVSSMVAIFSGTAILSVLAMFTRQSLIVVYIAAGIALGPWGLGWVASAETVQDIAQIGIVFLLFLIGMELHPERLLPILRQTFMMVVTSSVIFSATIMYVAYLFGFHIIEALIVGLAMMFSSTVIAVKMMPGRTNIRETIIGCVLLQDLLAILVLLGLTSFAKHEVDLLDYLALILLIPIGLPLLFLLERYVLNPLLKKYKNDEFHFNLIVAWCLAFGFLSHTFGLSYEIGAFLAGVVLSASDRLQSITNALVPLRDFFLILFFFSFGAMLNWNLVLQVGLQSLALVGVILLVKPWVFRWLVSERQNEKNSWEIGVRLTSLSEFSIIIGYSAFELNLIGNNSLHLISVTTMIMFLVSSTWVNARYPTTQEY